MTPHWHGVSVVPVRFLDWLSFVPLIPGRILVKIVGWLLLLGDLAVMVLGGFTVIPMGFVFPGLFIAWFGGSLAGVVDNEGEIY